MDRRVFGLLLEEEFERVPLRFFTRKNEFMKTIRLEHKKETHQFPSGANLKTMPSISGVI